MALTESLGGTGGASPANPTATASDTAVNGSAATFMRSDAAPAVQKASASVFGVVKVDGTSITATGGVISAPATAVAAPGAIADLIYWFESDEILGTSGLIVPVLRNRSPAYLGANANGVGTGAQGSGATVASTTLNSLPVVNFIGNSTGRYANVANLTGVFNGGATVFVVFNPTSLAAVSTFIAGVTGSLQLTVTTAGKLQWVKTNTIIIGTDTTVFSTGTWYQANATYLPSSGAFAFRVARAASASGTNAQSVNATNNAVGYNSSVNSEDLNAKVAAIIVYARVLSGGEITTVENYLNAKWGV
jgi:hypothetical protein